MRVAMIALEWPRAGGAAGGVGRYVYRLADVLRHHVDLTIYTLEGMRDLDGVDIVQLPKPRHQLDRYYLSPLRVARELRTRKFDVVHSHGDDWAIPGGVDVRTFHGTARGEAAYGRRLRRYNHVVLSRLEDRSAKRSRLRVGVGPDSVDTFSCSFLIPPFIGMRVGSKEKTEVPSAAFIGAYTGRKRGWLALEAVAAARELRPDLAFHVFGPASDRQHYPAWVDFRHDASDEDIQATLRSCWVLLSPSFYEGFGIPLVEGLAAGCTVVSSPNPGSLFVGGDSRPEMQIVADPEYATSVCRLLTAAKPPAGHRGMSRARELIDMADPQRYLSLYARALQGRESRGSTM